MYFFCWLAACRAPYREITWQLNHFVVITLYQLLPLSYFQKLKNSSDFDYNDPTKIAPDSSVRWIPSVSNSCASGAKQSIGLTFSIQIQYLYNIIIPNFKCFHFSDKNCTILCNANLANFFLNFYWIANYFVIMVFEFVVKIIFVCFIFWLKKGEC